MDIGDGVISRRDDRAADLNRGFPSRAVPWLLVVLTAWLLFFSLRFAAQTMHWGRVHDGPIIAYMVYLMDHGMVPYRDIVEVQFPGTLMLYWIEMHLFGAGDLGFRVFDLCGIAAATAAMVWASASARAWFAGVFAGALVVLSHVSNGIIEVGQRDFFVACFLLCGAAFLLQAVRLNRPVLMSFYGALVAASVSIKPTSGIYLLLLVPAFFELRRRQRGFGAYLGMTALGLAAVASAVVGFLLEEHAFSGFFGIVRNLIPVYAGIANPSYFEILVSLKQSLPLMLFGGELLLLSREMRRDFMQQTLLLSFVLGAVTLFVQHKGFAYHRAPFMYFLFWWGGYVMTSMLRERFAFRCVSAALLVTCCVGAYPFLQKRPVYSEKLLPKLQGDLEALHAGQHEVQCMDITDGCLNVLMRMHLTMATGYVSDYYFFLPNQSPVLTGMRSDFVARIGEPGMRILVITNQQWPTRDERGYGQIDSWPGLREALRTEFRLAKQMDGPDAGSPGYRIYVRRE